MSKRTISFVLVVLGVVVAVVSLALDVIGLGNRTGIGWIQLLGAAIGVIILLIGVWLNLSKSKQKQ